MLHYILDIFFVLFHILYEYTQHKRHENILLKLYPSS